MMSQQSAVTSSSRHGWDAGQYLFFANERTQPALDLVARIESEAPARIVDLGCGPGNSTGLLLARWPQAAVTGIDNSPEMLAAAGRDHPDIMFAPADIATWSPVKRYELVFSNAALQWVGDHAAVVGRWLAAVAPGGALAVQMPRNHDFATHRLMRRVAAEGPWAARLIGARDPSPVKAPEFYYDRLAPLSRRFVLWETNYIQIMDGVGDIIRWLQGTGLRPFLARLDAQEQGNFLDRYAALLTEEFPPQVDGRILLPYPRLFFIAYRE